MTTRQLARLLSSLLLATPVAAQETMQIQQVDWSSTFIGQYMYIDPSDRSDDRGYFFDQYQWTPNRGSSFPAELALRDGSLDVFGADETPLLQARLESPTSNLGVSGQQIDEPFFNQHIDAIGRRRGAALDFHYDRIRTEQLRLFPNTAAAGLLFDDRTDPDDRFFRDRTGFDAQLKVQPYLLLDRLDAPGSQLTPEFALRGGYEARGGKRQLLVHRAPSNEWLGVPEDTDRSVWDVGSGVVFVPFDGTTLNFDYDYQRFEVESAQLLESDLGYPPPLGNRTIGFVPNSERSTLSTQLQSKLGERTQLRTGFRYSDLAQISEFTPNERGAGLDDNRLRYYAADADLRVRVREGLHVLGAVAWDRRDNDIDRNTALFNSSNGTQVGPFLKRFDRFVARLEAEQRVRRLGALTLGVRYEDIERELRYSTANAPRILPVNAWIGDETRMVDVYARANLRPLKRVKLFGEVGYRIAPETGYMTDLDDLVYGKLRTSYVVPTTRPVVLSGYLQGRRGRNSNFEAVAGMGPNPAGPDLQRGYERSSIGGGLTVSHSPVADVSLFASFYGGRNEQETGLDLSNLQRSAQDIAPITFRSPGDSRFHDRQLSLVTGLNLRLAKRIDTAFSYSFTQAKGLYQGDPASPELDWIEGNHRIDADIHGIDLEVGSWIRKGMRVLAGYRLQYFKERVDVPESIASVVRPGNSDTYQHTYTLGLTLTSDFFAAR